MQGCPQILSQGYEHQLGKLGILRQRSTKLALHDQSWCQHLRIAAQPAPQPQQRASTSATIVIATSVPRLDSPAISGHDETNQQRRRKPWSSSLQWTNNNNNNNT